MKLCWLWKLPEAPVDYLYSLYDALVSINVPSDKARAVVDAMERDMGTTLATKQDMEMLKLATRQDLEKVSWRRSRTSCCCGRS